MNLGSGVDIDVLKKGNNQVEVDQANNMLLWHVANIREEGNAVLSFASEKIQFDEMFPFELRFDETYSLIDVDVKQVVNASTQEPLSLKLIHSLQTENYRVSLD